MNEELKVLKEIRLLLQIIAGLICFVTPISYIACWNIGKILEHLSKGKP